MGTLHQQFVIMLIIGITTSLQADFFLFRKMEHAETKKIVCLLYDVHASIISDSEIYEGIRREIDKIVEELSKYKGERDPSKANEMFFNRFRDQMHILQSITPNLVKQQADLADLINYCSLVVEDWSNFDIEEFTTYMIHPKIIHKYSAFIRKAMGKEWQYGDIVYRAFVSPMSGIGKKIAGSFSEGKFVPVGLSYFYNPDSRHAVVSGVAKVVDDNTIKAIDQLFTTYKQSMIVVAEGYNHMVAIAKMLDDKGYQTAQLIMSDDLLRRSQLNKKLSDFLEDLKNNVKPKLEIETKIGDVIVPDWVYFLIADPLDLRKVFAEEFPEVFKNDEALLSLQHNLSLMGL